MPPIAELLAETIRGWVEDPESDVVHAEEVEGRWAMRVRQTVREATTVWWEWGEWSVWAEAHVLPAPPGGGEALFRLCLARNRRAWRVHFALDPEGAIVLRGRIGVDEVTPERLDRMLAELYELVEITFRPLVRLASGGASGSG